MIRNRKLFVPLDPDEAGINLTNKARTTYSGGSTLSNRINSNYILLKFANKEVLEAFKKFVDVNQKIRVAKKEWLDKDGSLRNSKKIKIKELNFDEEGKTYFIAVDGKEVGGGLGKNFKNAAKS